jgi:hypothetical protein
MEAAVKFFNDTIQWAGWKATPEHTLTYDCPVLIKKKMKKAEECVEVGLTSAHTKPT